MQHASSTTATNHYLYNGKELNEDLGLDWYDYGFRWYDAKLGRFPSVDPIIENFPYITPYNYAENKPINSIDLWGLQSFPMYNNAGRVDGDAQDFVEEHPKTAAAIAVAYIAIPIAIWAGPKAAIAFLANEAKDEVLSQATGGVSDYADVTKMGRKGIQKVADSETAKKILDAPSKGKTPRTITTIVDEDTGKIYTGTNQARKVEDLNPEVQKLLPNKSKEPWPCTNCSEVGAVNNAANDGAKVGKNLKAITNQVDKKTNTFRPIETCKNCKETTRNIDVLSDKY